MGIFDYIIIGIVAAAVLAAVRFLKKNGRCTGDCANCGKRKK